MQDNLAPIVLFVYARPEHTRKTLEALENNILADQSLLFIYADGLKVNANEEQGKNFQATRALIRKKWRFKEVCIIEREKNWGLADNIVDGVTQIVNRYGKVIVLEDDVVPATGFLQYMNDALNFYENEEKVMHISAYIFPVNKVLPTTFFYNTATCWGWGTWQRAWCYFEPSAAKLAQIIAEKGLIHQFNVQGGYNFYGDLLANANQQMKTWSVRWYASFFLQQGFALHPYPSLVNNIGHDGTGENSSNVGIFLWKKLAQEIKIEPIEIKESQKAIDLIIKFHNPGKSFKDYSKQILKFLLPKFIIQQLKALKINFK
jgi:hypothetical protein